MTLRNEIFEGIAAMKGTQEAFGGTPRDRYYNELYKAARRENDDFTARRVAREKAIAAGRPSTPTQLAPPRMASSAPPVVQQAFSPTALPQDPNYQETYAEGGMVRADGGPVLLDDSDDLEPPFDPEGSGYDSRTARLAGIKRGPDGHMASRDPVTGMQLKGRRHPTFDKAIETDRREGYGLEMRDGRYYTQKFADGGAVLGDLQRQHLMENTRAIREPGTNPAGGSMEFAGIPAENEADQIVQQLLKGVDAKTNAMVGRPEQDVPDPSAEYETQRDRMKAAVPSPSPPPAVRMRRPVAQGTLDTTLEREAPEPVPPPALDTSRMQLENQVPPPSQPTGVSPATQWNVRGAGDRARMATMIGKIPAPADTPSPTDDPRTDFQRRIDESNPLGRTLIDDVRDILPAGRDLETTAREQAARRGIETSEPAQALDTRAYGRAARPPFDPGETGGIPATGGQTPSASPYGPAKGTPEDPDNIGQRNMVPRQATTQPNQTPANGAAVTPQGSQVSGQTNGPPVANPQPGPTGTAGNRAPPAGSTSANMPTGAPKTGQDDGMAPGPGGTRVRRGSLQDQTRVAAFDPVADFNDPNRAPATAPLSSYTPQDLQQTLAGAASVATPGPVGQGAVPRTTFDPYWQKHSQGGKFTPGEAMLVGMLSDYKMLLSQGRVDQANKMAYGLIQAASLEAASYGMVARDALKAGDHVSALNNGVMALNYLPDGKTFKASPDGKTIMAYDAQTGQQTGSAQVTPQQLLALITGISDGSLLWQALQSSASMLVKPDRNAEGRQLTNALRREQIEGARLRNAKLRSGGGGKAAPGFSDPAARLNALLSGGQRGGGSEGTTPRAQGDDTSYIDVETADPPDTE